jgi:hypothetical protein
MPAREVLQIATKTAIQINAVTFPNRNMVWLLEGKNGINPFATEASPLSTTIGPQFGSFNSAEGDSDIRNERRQNY